ncbi:MAG: PQQ-like beta-propeller repeat protein [Pirellulaceae bacterium]|nr:PQQ-like beta-propeller repeat protein [Pirellulaceae bacterium]
MLRQFLLSLIVALTLLSAFCDIPFVDLCVVAQEPTQGDDTEITDPVRESDAFLWPRFLGRQYDSVADAVPGVDWTKQPTFLWSLDVGLGYGMGTVDQTNYYHFDASDNAAEERLRCIDLRDGQTKWSQSQPLNYRDMYGYESGPRSSASLTKDRIYTMGVGGQLTCRDIADGRLIWTVDTSQRYGVVQNFFGVGGSPLVLGDLVIVMVGGSPPGDQAIAPGRLDRVSPNGSALVAFDRHNGSEKWRGGDDLASYSSPRPIEIDGETLVLLFGRNRLSALNPTTGTVRWSFDHRAEILESVNAMVPIVHDDHVFISECYAVGSVLLKVTGESADVIWQDPPRDRRRQAMRVHWSTPVLTDGHVFGCSGRNAPDSDFRCIEWMTGKVKWSDSRRIRSAVTQVGDHLLVLEERGLMQVIKANVEEMEVVNEWELQTAEGNRPALNYPCWAAPIVVGDKVLVRGDEKVLCLELQKK